MILKLLFDAQAVCVCVCWWSLSCPSVVSSWNLLAWGGNQLVRTWVSNSLWPAYLVHSWIGFPSWTFIGRPCHRNHLHFPFPSAPPIDFGHISLHNRSYFWSSFWPSPWSSQGLFAWLIERFLRGGLRTCFVTLGEGALGSGAAETRSGAWDVVTTPRPVGRGSPPSSSHEYKSLLVKSLFLIFAFVFVQTSLVELGWNRENKSRESLGSWVLGKSTSESDPSWRSPWSDFSLREGVQQLQECLVRQNDHWPTGGKILQRLSCMVPLATSLQGFLCYNCLLWCGKRLSVDVSRTGVTTTTNLAFQRWGLLQIASIPRCDWARFMGSLPRWVRWGVHVQEEEVYEPPVCGRWHAWRRTEQSSSLRRPFGCGLLPGY